MGDKLTTYKSDRVTEGESVMSLKRCVLRDEGTRLGKAPGRGKVGAGEARREGLQRERRQIAGRRGGRGERDRRKRQREAERQTER